MGKLQHGAGGIEFLRECLAGRADQQVLFDQSIDTVVSRTVGDTLKLIVQYGNRERGVLPSSVESRRTTCSTI